ncbi:HAD family phosphatase [Variovorax sp. J2P1-59]|uniref:HAD family hydrolase n=1 Tax=Variovorax flavidus TaxID=3053501 RepID=UPI002575C203|nr:HAD family phosphatase [Variovorax sp. J2P1-59]MDM0075387.1 HAD family phosphatase [Variovorax sp. J2P1-59]
MNASISLVLFDLDGVLCHYDRSARVEHLAASTHQSAEAVRHAIWGTGLESRADAGLIGDDDYLDELGRLLGSPVTLDAWLEARRAAMTLDAQVLRMAQAVATRCRIAIFTNNCRLLALHMRRLCPEVAALFGNAIHTTAEFGATKPAPEAYLRCVEALGVSPGETFFIDDVESNVAGALRAGLQAYEFANAAGLALELKLRGLG